MNILSQYNKIFTEANKIQQKPDIKTAINISGEESPSFKNIINNEIEKLNDKQIKADQLTQGFISGQVEDLHTVLIATEEARLSLELAVQVRNKCVEAYKEINNMQL